MESFISTVKCRYGVNFYGEHTKSVQYIQELCLIMRPLSSGTTKAVQCLVGKDANCLSSSRKETCLK